MSRLSFAFFAMLLLALIPHTAQATLLSGTGGAPSDPIFLGPAITDFESVSSGAYTSITLGNNTFTGNSAFDIDGANAGNYNIDGAKSFHSIVGPPPGFVILPSTITVKFTLPVAAFAFNFGAADNSWQMNAYDSSNTLIESHIIAEITNSNAGDYFGVAAADIKRVDLIDQVDNPFDQNGDVVFIDDFTTSYELAPEPASLALLAIVGFNCVAIRRRRA